MGNRVDLKVTGEEQLQGIKGYTDVSSLGRSLNHKGKTQNDFLLCTALVGLYLMLSTKVSSSFTSNSTQEAKIQYKLTPEILHSIMC